MAKRNHSSRDSGAELVVGMDVGDRKCELHLLRSEQDQAKRASVSTTRDALSSYFSVLQPKARVILETGTHSNWISDLLTSLGHQPLVVNSRRLALISKQASKSDANDAELLAYLGLDARRATKLLQPVQVKPAQMRADLALLRGRDALVRARTMLINCCRGLAKAQGERLPKCDAEVFHKLKDTVKEPQRATLSAQFQAIASLTEQIQALNQQVDELAEQKYPMTQRLTQVSGVGNLVALAYVLSVADPKRFQKSRQVGAYFGLVPRRAQSGEEDPELRITKAGSPLVRRLLVQSAQTILRERSPDSDLKRQGKKLSGTSKREKRRAVVAVARKLSVLLHRLWVSGETYQPVGYGKKEQAA